MAIFNPYHTHFLLMCGIARFCRKIRANPPLSDPCPPPMPKSVGVTLGILIFSPRTWDGKTREGMAILIQFLTMLKLFFSPYADMEKVASMQAMLADNF